MPPRVIPQEDTALEHLRRKTNTITVDWYFDVVSPFAYLQLREFPVFPETVHVVLRPVLLAGLLAHWGQLGPAEIPPKRLHTYRLCQWLADSRAIPFKMPPRHPFSPLAILRLLTASDCRLVDVVAAFDVIYREGRDAEEPETFAEIASRLDPSGDADAARARAESPRAKAQLRLNTEEALARGVFGVPTFHHRGEIFWGSDAVGMLLDFIENPALFATPEMRRLASLPSKQRPRQRPVSDAPL